MPPAYDALLVVSFGGPEKPDDVVPFLENVVRGKDVPRRRLAEVAEHYELFGGESPINAQTPRDAGRAVRRAQRPRTAAAGVLGQSQLAPHARRHAAARWPTTECATPWRLSRRRSAPIRAAGSTRRTSSVPGGKWATPRPRSTSSGLFYNHPGFIEAMADRVTAAAAQIPEQRRDWARVVFTAHSLPLAMARRCRYEAQLREACRLVAEWVGGLDWRLAYQSRSGRPTEPWLEPDVGDAIVKLHATGDASDVLVVPIGFLVETMETVFDLDVEIGGLCEHLGVNMVRASTAGTHPRLVRMIRELAEERLDAEAPRLALGEDGPWPDVCPEGCCRPG